MKLGIANRIVPRLRAREKENQPSHRELRELMEQTRLLWYNTSGFEAAVLKDVKEQMLLQDKQAGARIGGGR